MCSYSQERNEERMEKAPKKFLDIFAIFATTRYCDPVGVIPVFPFFSSKHPGHRFAENPPDNHFLQLADPPYCYGGIRVCQKAGCAIGKA
jgi:hypothetical protein